MDGGSLEGGRVLKPQTLPIMTSNHLNKDIKNNVSKTESGRIGDELGPAVAIRTHRGLSTIKGYVGDFTWSGAYGALGK